MPNTSTAVDDLSLTELSSRLSRSSIPEIVDELGRTNSRRRAVMFRLLDKQRALEVFEDLAPKLQHSLLAHLHDDDVAAIFNDLDPDDRAALLDELPAGLASKLMSGLDDDAHNRTAALLGYPKGSAGRRMSPDAAMLRPDITATDALAHLGSLAPSVTTIYMVPVTDNERRILGVVSARTLLGAPPDTPVSSLMVPATTVAATATGEEAANVVRDGGYVAVPVVDHEKRVLGVLTVDDAMRVLEAEEDVDSARVGGSEPLHQPYMSASIATIVRSRVVWLLVLIAAATLTVGVQKYFEDELEKVVALAIFIPLLIGTGGNAGAQASTTIVRAMAVGDVRNSDLTRVVLREALTGAILGLTLGAVGIIPAIVVTDVGVGATLSLSLVAICTMATTVGASIPILAKVIHADPAIVSAPFISTFCDSTGLIMYFLIAKAVLGI